MEGVSQMNGRSNRKIARTGRRVFEKIERMDLPGGFIVRTRIDTQATPLTKNYLAKRILKRANGKKGS